MRAWEVRRPPLRNRRQDRNPLASIHLRELPFLSGPGFTGWDEDGGYAEYAVVSEDFAYLLPGTFDDEHVAPLLCAGIIGYRALRKCSLPSGGRLRIYGFGGSAHIAAQVALHEEATVHVVARSGRAQDLARSLGIDSVRGSHEPPPELLDAARRGGVLAQGGRDPDPGHHHRLPAGVGGGCVAGHGPQRTGGCRSPQIGVTSSYRER